VDRPTVAVYDAAAEAWRARREVRRAAAAQALARNVAAAGGGPVVDLGCGPGWQLPMLGAAAVGLDASRGMVGLARAEYPDVALVRADLEALPFRTGSLGGAWASRSYIHVERCALPLALADLHRALAPDAAVELTLFEGDSDLAAFPDDDFTGRRFAGWTPEALTDVVGGAGFRADVRTEERQLVVSGVRARTLPDFVAPNLRLLTCGLNPSLHAADAGYGYAGPSNRFWTAVVEAGLVRHPRQPRRMVVEDGVGMTCLVKRATARADELSAAEYRAGDAWCAGSSRR
jgi:SAM-dependent methyltransferase